MDPSDALAAAGRASVDRLLRRGGSVAGDLSLLRRGDRATRPIATAGTQRALRVVRRRPPRVRIRGSPTSGWTVGRAEPSTGHDSPALARVRAHDRVPSAGRTGWGQRDVAP